MEFGLQLEGHFERFASYSIKTPFGVFERISYVNWASRDLQNPNEPERHLALVRGDVSGKSNLLVRIQSRCFDSEVIGDVSCDCREQKEMAMERIVAENLGVLVYLLQEGKGLGELVKMRAHNIAEREGIDFYDAVLSMGIKPDVRSYLAAAEIITDLGLQPPIRLLTNNPDRLEQLAAYGIEAVRVPLEAVVTEDNRESLRYRKAKMRHMLNLP